MMMCVLPMLVKQARRVREERKQRRRKTRIDRRWCVGRMVLCISILLVGLDEAG